MVAGMACRARAPGGVQELLGRDAPKERLDRVHQGKKRSGQKLLKLSDPGMCMEPKCLYSSWFKEPEEVAPAACHFESGGSSSTAKKKVVHARRRRALSETNPGGLSTKIQEIAARQPSFHLCYPTRLPYQAIAVWGSRRRRRHRHVTMWERYGPNCTNGPSSREHPLG